MKAASDFNLIKMSSRMKGAGNELSSPVTPGSPRQRTIGQEACKTPLREYHLPKGLTTLQRNSAKSRATMSSISRRTINSERIVTPSSPSDPNLVKSRGRPIKPFETEPFLSIDTLPPEKTFITEKSVQNSSSRCGVRRGSNTRLSCTATPTEVDTGIAHMYITNNAGSPPQSPQRSNTFQDDTRPGSTVYQSPNKTPRQANHCVRTPFKHQVIRPDLDQPDDRATPSMAMKEKTAIAAFHVNKMLTVAGEKDAHKVPGKLKKGKLKPMYPVAVEGPSMSQCRGIISEAHTYGPPPNRTLQRQIDIIQSIPNIHSYLYDRPQTGESIHRTSIASSMDEPFDADVLESDRDLPDEVLYTQKPRPEPMTPANTFIPGAPHASPCEERASTEPVPGTSQTSQSQTPTAAETVKNTSQNARIENPNYATASVITCSEVAGVSTTEEGLVQGVIFESSGLTEQGVSVDQSEEGVVSAGVVRQESASKSVRFAKENMTEGSSYSAQTDKDMKQIMNENIAKQQKEGEEDQREPQDDIDGGTGTVDGNVETNNKKNSAEKNSREKNSRESCKSDHIEDVFRKDDDEDDAGRDNQGKGGRKENSSGCSNRGVSSGQGASQGNGNDKGTGSKQQGDNKKDSNTDSDMGTKSSKVTEGNSNGKGYKGRSNRSGSFNADTEAYGPGYWQEVEQLIAKKQRKLSRRRDSNSSLASDITNASKTGKALKVAIDPSTNKLSRPSSAKATDKKIPSSARTNAGRKDVQPSSARGSHNSRKIPRPSSDNPNTRKPPASGGNSENETSGEGRGTSSVENNSEKELKPTSSRKVLKKRPSSGISSVNRKPSTEFANAQKHLPRPASASGRCSRFEKSNASKKHNQALEVTSVNHGNTVATILCPESPKRSRSRSRSPFKSAETNSTQEGTKADDKFHFFSEKPKAKGCLEGEVGNWNDDLVVMGAGAHTGTKVKFAIEGEEKAEPIMETIFIDDDDGDVNIRQDKEIDFNVLEHELAMLRHTIHNSLLENIASNTASESEYETDNECGTVSMINNNNNNNENDGELVEERLEGTSRSEVRETDTIRDMIGADYSNMIEKYRLRCMERSEACGAMSGCMVTARDGSRSGSNLTDHGAGRPRSGSRSNDRRRNSFSKSRKDSINTVFSDSGCGSVENISEYVDSRSMSRSMTPIPRLDLGLGADSTSDLGLGTGRSDVTLVTSSRKGDEEGKTFLELVCDQLPTEPKPEKSPTRKEVDEDLSGLKVVATTKSLSKTHNGSRVVISKDTRAPFPPLCFTINARPPPGHLYYFAYGTDMNPDRLGSYIHRKVDKRYWGLLFGFNLVFNKRGLGEEAEGFSNLEFNPLRSVEGCIYKITQSELQILDKCVGYPEHYEHLMLPVWLSNTSDPDAVGVSQYCVPALTYIAQQQWTETERKLPCDYALSQCIKSADIVTPSYRDSLVAMKTPQPVSVVG